MRYILLLITIVLISCVPGEEKPAVPADDSGTVKKFFPRFPDQQFEFITLGEETNKIEKTLLSNDYKLKPDQPKQYRNEAMQAEVILPDQPILTSFKVFLYNKNDVASYQDFVVFFSKQAKMYTASDEFSVFDFETIEQDFSITIFQQPDFLRLNYELNSKH